MLKTFKRVAILEGISYIVILLNMLIVKKISILLYKQILFPVGMSHGVLFIGYIILAMLLMKPQKWDFKTLAIILGASLIPFGTFYIEKKYLRDA
ncbi:MAG: DUF3817 domain-containing protein [Limnohabitans sp.]|nr:DUF3817 domain-containing protein [Limnohabitans sp.]